MAPRAIVASSVILTFATAACATRTVPPAMPDPAIPDVAAPEVAADSGLARVLIGADVPASVWALSRVSGYRGPYEARTLLCATTPCAVTLPYGDHEIELAALDAPERTTTTIAHVNSSQVVLNSTLGRRYTPRPGQVAGAMLLTVGLVGLAAAGAVTSEPPKSGSNALGQAASGAVAWTIGLGGLALGVFLLAANPTIEQPGATREWTPPARVAGSSLGIKF